MANFQPGQAVRLYAEFRDKDGVLFNPDEIVSVEILAQDNTVIDTIEGGWEQESHGIYSVVINLPVNQFFVWHRWSIVNGGVADRRSMKIEIKK